ncbi:uncharacterized protein LOC110723872 isoform X2 [Chenopodium quinoa]|nr:uncharacterized protein LOC110723872 isoform X2 [Chenopodium quinoa]
MGFSGLLSVPGDLQLLRQICYWLMSRIDPVSRKLIGCDGKDFFFSKNQEQWVLGIPNGGLPIPSYKTMNYVERAKVDEILCKYGKSLQSKSSRDCDRVYYSKSIAVDSKIMDLVEGVWLDDQEEEFKTLFLLLALDLVLCPTQSPRLAVDLIPALTCAMKCASYDWCGLVIDFFMESVSSFACRFYGSGYAVGCGGCSIFVVLFYLDRLNRNPVDWGVSPRIKVWTMKLIRSACRADRTTLNGDYGKLGMLDVAYGEHHPRCARDIEAPGPIEQGACLSSVSVRKRRRATTDKTPFMRKREKAKSAGEVGESLLCVGSFLCPRFKSIVGRMRDIDAVIDRCEITVFFPNSLKWVVFITSSQSVFETFSCVQFTESVRGNHFAVTDAFNPFRPFRIPL